MTTKKKSIPSKSVKPGLYNAIITKVEDAGYGKVTVQLQLYGKGFTFTENHTLEVKEVPDRLAEAGYDKYYIICARLSIYTTIGADNRHHAANKATKLFGPNWSSLTQADRLVDYLQFTSVTTFKKLLSSL